MPEFEINNFQGIFRGSVKPPKNGASELRNFDLRGQSGVLEQRFGYSKVFDNLPSGRNLSAMTYLSAENFYIPGVGLGQEITIQVGKGTLTSEQTAPISPGTFQIPLIWASHEWDGSAWQSKTHSSFNWNWLNETVITSLNAVDPAVDGSMHKIVTDITDDGRVASKYFNGWYIANFDEGKVHRIVDSFVWNDGLNDRIAFKLDADANYWNPVVEGILYIMKNYIPITALEAMKTAVRNDITFLKIRDEIRISFGPKVDRIALSVSYQKNYLNIKEFEVEAYSSGLIDAYCKTDGLILTPYSLLTEEVQLSLTQVGSGAYPADKHYLKATATMIAGDEILITEESQLTTTGPTGLFLNASILVATLNKLAKTIKFYYSNETLLKVFYLVFEDNLRSDNREDIFKVDLDGKMSLIDTALEIHDPGTDGAAAPVTTADPLDIGDWLESGNKATLSAIADAGAGSDNVLDLELTAANYALMTMIYYPSGGMVGIASDTLYDGTIWLKRDAGTVVNTLQAYFRNREDNMIYGPLSTITFTAAWTEYTFQIRTPVIDDVTKLELVFDFGFGALGRMPIGETVRVDRLSIIAFAKHTLTEDTELQTEMSIEMGYTPTRNLVKSWEWGLVTAGRTFVNNVFIEKFYTNMIFYSPIGGDANSMYDALPAGLRYDVENFDGNDVRKIELLSNADFLLLQSIASQRLDPDSGRTANIGASSGTVQPFASVNFGDRVIFPSKYDVLMTSGVGVSDISEDTIRAAYRDLGDAEIAKMHASKDLFGNAYVLYSGKTSTKAEFILTNKGWIERRFTLEPERYFLNRQGELRFLSAGNIYNVSKSATKDLSTTITSLWQSIVFDAEALGESMRADMRFVITDFFVEFISNGDLTFKLYLLDKVPTVTHDTQIIPKTTTTGLITYRRPFKQAATCSRFQLELSYTGDAGPAECSIFSVGVVYDVIGSKLHA